MNGGRERPPNLLEPTLEVCPSQFEYQRRKGDSGRNEKRKLRSIVPNELWLSQNPLLMSVPIPMHLHVESADALI